MLLRRQLAPSKLELKVLRYNFCTAGLGSKMQSFKVGEEQRIKFCQFSLALLGVYGRWILALTPSKYSQLQQSIRRVTVRFNHRIRSRTASVAGKECALSNSLVHSSRAAAFSNVGTHDGCGCGGLGQSSQGPPAGHDLFHCSLFATPTTSGMRNRSMSPTTRLRGTASM